MNVTFGIVLGCPRSGTSFLMKALEALPYTECISGRVLPYHIAHIVNQPLSKEVYAALSRSLEFSLRFHLRDMQSRRFHAVEKFLRRTLNFSELIQALRRKRQIQRIIFKEPFLAFAPEFTFGAIPDSRIIYIYRDGRDCADSLVRSFDALSDTKLTNLLSGEVGIGSKHNGLYIPWWVQEGKEDEFIAATPYVRSIWMWREMVRRCQSFFLSPDVVNSGRILLLKYEELIGDPIGFGELIAKHLRTTLTRRARANLKRASSRSIGIHGKRDLREIKEAERIARSELELFGYL